MSITGTLLAANDTYEGFIADLMVDADITLEPTKNKTTEKHPDFTVTAKSPRGRVIQIGAAWWKTSEAKNRMLSIRVNIAGNTLNVNAVGKTDNVEELTIYPWAD